VVKKLNVIAQLYTQKCVAAPHWNSCSKCIPTTWNTYFYWVLHIYVHFLFHVISQFQLQKNMTNFIGKTMIHNTDIMAEGRHDFSIFGKSKSKTTTR